MIYIPHDILANDISFDKKDATNQSNCNNGSIDLHIDGGFSPYDVVWKGPNNFTSSANGISGNNGDEDINNLVPGEYVVVVTDQLCGEATITVEIICITCPSLLQGVKHYGFIECEGKKGKLTAILTGDGEPPITYLWSNGATTATIENLNPGNYTITVTDDNGCTSSQTVNLYVVNPAIQLFSGEDLIVEDACHNNLASGSIRFRQPFGLGYYYSWTGTGGYSSNNQDIYNLTPGQYCVEVRHIQKPDCIYAKGCVIVGINPGPKIVLTDKKNISLCKGQNSSCQGLLSISVPGGYDEIFWTGIPNASQAHGLTVTNLCKGTYTVEVCKGNCCSFATFEITCCEVLDGDTSGGYDPISGSGVANSNTKTINITVSGGKPPYYVVWTGPGGFTSSSLNLTGLENGLYCVRVFDGCSEYAECFEIVDCTTQNIAINGTVTNTCNGYSVGIISVSTSGGAAPYKYKWSNGASTATISNLAQGTYCVTVTDKHYCTSTSCFTVNTINPTIVRIGCVFYTYCNGSVVAPPLDIGSYAVTNPSDCRYQDHYCSDGVYQNTTYVGTYFQKGTGCIIYERCRLTNEIFRIHRGQFFSYDVGPALDASGCFICHHFSYCIFPTLNNHITDFNQQFTGNITNFSGGTDCNEENESFDCYVKLYCNGALVGEGCDTDCDITSCYFSIGQSKPMLSSNNLNILEFNNEINIYPNPADDKLNISVPPFMHNVKYDINKPFTINIYSFDGKLLKNVSDEILTDEPYEIDISNFNAGPFKVILIQNGHLIFQSTFIKS